MLRRIRCTRRPAALSASLAAVLGPLSPPAAAEGQARARYGSTALRLDAPATFPMYLADEDSPGVEARGDGGPAWNVTVGVDTSGLTGFAAPSRGGYGNCSTGPGSRWSLRRRVRRR
ncbi:hypothetical protein ACWEKM_11905 [Streptomyces sp. NPDC004752]